MLPVVLYAVFFVVPAVELSLDVPVGFFVLFLMEISVLFSVVFHKVPYVR